MNEKKPDRVGQVFAALGKSVCYVLLFLGAQVAVMLPTVFKAIVQSALGVDEGEIYALLSADGVAYTLVSGLITIAIVLVFYLIRRKKLSEALWLRPVPAPVLFTGAALAPGMYVVVSVALALLPEAWTESYNEAASSIDTGTVVGIISVALVAPVVEEIIFRGLMTNRLSRVMPGWLAVLLSAAVFGACHGHPVWFGYAFVLGAVFGWIDLRAGSILPSILGHIVFNAIGQIMTFLPESEEGMEAVAALGVLLLVGIVALLLDRKAIGALFRPVPKAGPAEDHDLPTAPGGCGYDPWEE